MLASADFWKPSRHTTFLVAFASGVSKPESTGASLEVGIVARLCVQ